MGVSILFQISRPPPNIVKTLSGYQKKMIIITQKCMQWWFSNCQYILKKCSMDACNICVPCGNPGKNLYYLLNMDYSDFSLSSEKLRRDILTRLMKTDDVSNGVWVKECFNFLLRSKKIFLESRVKIRDLTDRTHAKLCPTLCYLCTGLLIWKLQNSFIRKLQSIKFLDP